MSDLTDFIRESNRIEGIVREPTKEEISAAENFLALGQITVDDVAMLVSVFQPDARLRNRPGMNVRVGRHVAPEGGPEIEKELTGLLKAVNGDVLTPYNIHVWYETLHPFIDGNGRSGRMIWAWQMKQRTGFPLGFLHHFYYQTLGANSR